MSEPGKSGIEAVYEAVRRFGGVEAPAPPSGVVSDGVRVQPLRTPTLPPAAHTGCYLVGPSEGRGSLIVVDPASPYADEQGVLDALLDREAADGRPVEAIALTHHHGDHVGGAAHLSARLGVPVAAHAETARLLRGIVAVQRVLDDGDVIGAARAVFTPGHAPGHLCFVVGEAIIAGDMVAGVGTILIDPGEGDMTQYLASLEMMRVIGASRLLPAHGPVIADADGKLREYIAHRRMRESKVAAALKAAGRGKPRDLVPAAYADTPPALWALAERSLIAHLVKLERDGVARREDDDSWNIVSSG